METKQRVILVDDNDIVRDLTKAMLEREGFDVEAAATPFDALLMAERDERIDLLLTDVYMPGMNGLELADRLLELHPEASVLYTSGYADERIIAPGAVPSGTAFLPKPFTMAELVATTQDVFAATAMFAQPAAVAV